VAGADDDNVVRGIEHGQYIRPRWRQTCG
jgi:hypothetical protein